MLSLSIIIVIGYRMLNTRRNIFFSFFNSARARKITTNEKRERNTEKARDEAKGRQKKIIVC
jgi:hypothetical protein